TLASRPHTLSRRYVCLLIGPLLAGVFAATGTWADEDTDAPSSAIAPSPRVSAGHAVRRRRRLPDVREACSVRNLALTSDYLRCRAGGAAPSAASVSA